MACRSSISPEEDLAAIDAGLIARAKQSIDFASYALGSGTHRAALGKAHCQRASLSD